MIASVQLWLPREQVWTLMLELRATLWNAPGQEPSVSACKAPLAQSDDACVMLVEMPMQGHVGPEEYVHKNRCGASGVYGPRKSDCAVHGSCRALQSLYLEQSPLQSSFGTSCAFLCNQSAWKRCRTPPKATVLPVLSAFCAPSTVLAHNVEVDGKYGHCEPVIVQIGVDLTRSNELRIHLNMTFPALPCQGAPQPSCSHHYGGRHPS